MKAGEDMNILSQRSLAIPGSPLYVLASMFQEAKASGQDVISLGIGEPDSEAVWEARQAGKFEIEKGRAPYIGVCGKLSTRQLLARKYDAKPENVVVSNGAKTILAAVLWSIIDPGDVVLVPSPYYPPFIAVAESFGAEVRLIDTADSGFKLTADAVKKAIAGTKKRVKALIINSPNNPTAVTYDQTELLKISDLSKQYGFIVVADECYRHFSKDSSFSFRQLNPFSIVIDSASKQFGMPGWRVGWGVMPSEIAGKLAGYLNNFIGCPCSISDSALAGALAGKGLADFNIQRGTTLDWLCYLDIEPGYDASSGFYVFADFRRYVEHFGLHDGFELALLILEKTGVQLTPGIAFGDYPSYLRIAYCLENERLVEAFERMSRFLKR